MANKQFWFENAFHGKIYYMHNSDYDYNINNRKQFIADFCNADGYNDYCIFYIHHAQNKEVRTVQIYLTPYFELNTYNGNKLLNQTRKEFEFVKSSSSLKHYLAKVKQLVKNVDKDILKFQNYIISDKGL